MKPSPSVLRQVLHPAVIVGALGYFVDVYDLILFSIVRKPSLQGLGLPTEQILPTGVTLLNWQMGGMLIGGIFFGMLGDRFGRVALLFGSILLYSVANIANGFVHSIEAYALWRFIAGFGLAGELGGGITLVTEILPKELRGYGTAIVSSVGVFGAVIGGLVAQKVPWRDAYFIGGGLGLCLLVLRMSVAESKMFRQLREDHTHVSRGNFLSLFTNAERFMKYMRCILIGIPLWCVVGVLITFSPEISQALNIQGEIKPAQAVAFTYLGITFGGYASGHLSQWLQSRRKVLFGFLIFTAMTIAAYFCCRGLSSGTLYLVMLLIGFGVGYWTIFVTVAAEQFGTNIRATVATTVPNFVRGATVPLTLAFNALKPHGVIKSAAIVSAASILIALWAVWGMKETHGKDLDYVETI
ncbi:MAG TPA: MFS transporter [Candidatus Acidoferrales bacterium]|nr:MFS transporter [Candidatus Acidoferrales bacterium]